MLVSTVAIAWTSAVIAVEAIFASYLFPTGVISLPFTYNNPSVEPFGFLCIFNVYSFSFPSTLTFILTTVLSWVNCIVLVDSFNSSPIFWMLTPASS